MVARGWWKGLDIPCSSLYLGKQVLPSPGRGGAMLLSGDIWSVTLLGRAEGEGGTLMRPLELWWPDELPFGSLTMWRLTIGPPRPKQLTSACKPWPHSAIQLEFQAPHCYYELPPQSGSMASFRLRLGWLYYLSSKLGHFWEWKGAQNNRHEPGLSWGKAWMCGQPR